MKWIHLQNNCNHYTYYHMNLLLYSNKNNDNYLCKRLFSNQPAMNRDQPFRSENIYYLHNYVLMHYPLFVRSVYRFSANYNLRQNSYDQVHFRLSFRNGCKFEDLYRLQMRIDDLIQFLRLRRKSIFSEKCRWHLNSYVCARVALLYCRVSIELQGAVFELYCFPSTLRY